MSTKMFILIEGIFFLVIVYGFCLSQLYYLKKERKQDEQRAREQAVTVRSETAEG